MKSGKFRITASAFCLIAALALAVFTVYAWFYIHDSVDTRGLDTNITTGDVISFDIDYYYADYVSSTEDSVEFKMGNKINMTYWGQDEESKEGDEPYVPGEDEEEVRKMKAYHPRAATSLETDTAVLLKMTIKFADTASGDYDLSANVNHKDVYSATDFGEFTNNNYLSNVVYLQEAESRDGENFTVGGFDTRQNFIETSYNGDDDDLNKIPDDEKRKSSIDLLSFGPDGANRGDDGLRVITLYYIMDYMPDQIQALYSIMLSAQHESFSAATLNTHIRFLHDIVFTIG